MRLNLQKIIIWNTVNLFTTDRVKTAFLMTS